MATEKITKKIGRPRLWNTPEELQGLMDTYVDDCESRRKPITLSGLAFAIGVDRGTLLSYSHKDEFSRTIQNFKRRVEASLAEGLLTSPRTIGHIFALKNNHGWKDKVEVEHSQRGSFDDVFTANSINGDIVDSNDEPAYLLDE